MPVSESLTLSRVTLTFLCGRFGWTENYDLPYVAGGLDPLQVPRNIADMRRYLLPKNASIVSVLLRTRGAKRRTLQANEVEYFGRGIDTYFTTVPEQTDNDVQACFAFRTQGEEFMSSIRYLRCIPDDVITGDGSAVALPASWIIPMMPNGLPFSDGVKYANWMSALQYFLSYIKQVCVVARPALIVQEQNAVKGFRFGPIVSFSFRGVRNHKTGRPSNLSRGRASIR